MHSRGHIFSRARVNREYERSYVTFRRERGPSMDQRMMDTPTLDISVINNAPLPMPFAPKAGNHYSPVQSPVNK